MPKGQHTVPLHLVPITARARHQGHQGFPRLVNTEDSALRAHLLDIVAHERLTALLQPIVHMSDGGVMGYEGLIRGPSDSALHSPLSLFSVARAHGMEVEVEHLCRRVVIRRFAELGLQGKLFLNVSPECLLLRDARHGRTMALIHELGIDPAQVIIELTENQPTYDYDMMREAVLHYRRMGFQIAIDDLGEGFSSLRLWSELRPEYVKIDMHFIQGINHDPVKLQFVRSIREIAERSGTKVIAEGIEAEAELLVLRDLGVDFGQGYHLARPAAKPSTVNAEAVDSLRGHVISIYPQQKHAEKNMGIHKLLRRVRAYPPALTNNELYDIFMADSAMLVAPIVDEGKPLGLVSRYVMLEHFSRPYQRELYGKRSCQAFMDAGTIIADKDSSLQQVGFSMANGEAHHLANGFIITENGQYLGVGTGHDLMREITQLQITAARYANPLTQLPGNVPINEHIDRLLEGGATFWACYCDLDHFKPFNDVYGYRKGDDVIQLLGHILAANIDPDRDFLGHIGGDDFMLLLQSEDWDARCRAVLAEFEQAVRAFYPPEDCERGGFSSEDRQGRAVFYPLMTLSMGVVRVSPGRFSSHHEIATAATAAKTQAKKSAGNSVFLDRRAG
jgi:EAL domain-containing protein (putative c-di-GMP-specific phosphodiesterase class I)/GGDEF domain-containing protein